MHLVVLALTALSFGLIALCDRRRNAHERAARIALALALALLAYLVVALFRPERF